MNVRLPKAAIVLAASLVLMTTQVLAAPGSDTELKDKVQLNVLHGLASDQDLREIQALLGKSPDDPKAHFIAGQVLNALGFQNLAIEQFDACNQQDKTYFLTQYHELLTRGATYVYPITYYACKHYPGDSGVLYVQAKHELLASHDGEAADKFKAALDAKPVWPALYGDLSQLLWKRHRTTDALMYAKMALQNNPNDYNGNMVKVMAQCELSGKPQLYASDLLRVANRRPNNDAVQLMLARAYMHQRNYDKAIEPTLLAIKNGGAQTVEDASEILKQLMAICTKQRIVLDLDRVSPPNGHDFLSTVLRMRVSKALSELGAHKEATAMLLQALQMNDFFQAPLNYRLAEEYEAQREDQVALFFYKSAHELRPDDERFERAYFRAATRFQNRPNDLARRLKLMMYPTSRS